MTLRWRDLRENRGSAAIEFAIAVPVLVMIVWGIMQVGMVLEANAGVQQALGEGARYATIYDPATNSRPPDAAIATKITSSKFGIRGGTWQNPVIDTSQESSNGYITITVQYDLSTDFLFFSGPDISLTKSKRVYTQA